MTDGNSTLTCVKCQVGLSPATVSFRYLNRSFEHQVLRCPVCGQVYIPENLVTEKMKKVETALEEK